MKNGRPEGANGKARPPSREPGALRVYSPPGSVQGALTREHHRTGVAMHHARSPLSRVGTAAILLSLIAAPLLAQQNGSSTWNAKEVLAQETYVRPPAAIERLVAAPRQNNVTLANQSPDRKHFLDTKSVGLPTLQVFGKPHLYFAGLQVDFK